MTPRHITLLLSATALLLLSTTLAHAQSPAADGVYTATQATRGEALFTRHCAECHTPREFTSGAFVRAWAGRPVFDIYDAIRTQMPATNPGSLSVQVYVDIVAYLLRANGMPPGDVPLPVDDAALRRVLMPAWEQR